MPMKLLKIKDNTQIRKDTFSGIGSLTGRIADKTLEQLEREGVFVFSEFVVDTEKDGLVVGDRVYEKLIYVYKASLNG